MPLVSDATDGRAGAGDESSLPIRIVSMDHHISSDEWREAADTGCSGGCGCGCGCVGCMCKFRHHHRDSNPANYGEEGGAGVPAEGARFEDTPSTTGTSLSDEIASYGSSSVEAASSRLTSENLVRIDTQRWDLDLSESWYVRHYEDVDADPAYWFRSPTASPVGDFPEPTGEIDLDEGSGDSLHVGRDSSSVAETLSQYSASFYTPTGPSAILVRGAGMLFPAGPLPLQ